MTKGKYLIQTRLCDGEWSKEGSYETLADALYQAERLAGNLHSNETAYVFGVGSDGPARVVRGKRPIGG